MSNRSRGDGDHRSTPPNIDVMHSLKVDNLTYRTRVEDLRRCFDKFGPIGDIYIPRDQFSRSSRGYAFIRYLKKRDAEDALHRMDGSDLDGREIRVQFARYGRASTTDSRDKNSSSSGRRRR
jgi:arginine/serine-rich splicing factor 2